MEWWKEFLASTECLELTNLRKKETGDLTRSTMLGICRGDADDIEFYYSIGVEIPQGGSSGKFETIEIPPATWAVFDCTLANLQDVTKRIFGEWYLSTGYEHPGTPDLEVYLPEGEGQDMKCRIWAPVIKKK